MNSKIFKGIMACGLCLLLMTGCGGTSASGGNSDDNTNETVKTHTYDTETRPLTMSISAIDGNFNPFFYTSQNDGTVAGMTQISMLSTDGSGNIVCGENYPTVVKDYTMTYYDEKGNTLTSETATNDTCDHTTYSFLIKNGIKFSDGVDLTIMDVLFSIYVELDMAYTGSATMYSNDIQGLKAYRAQDASLTDDSTADYTTRFTTEGQTRIDNVISYYEGTGTLTTQVAADIETIKTLFKEELTEDWTSVYDSFGSRDLDTYEYNFEYAWQAYLLAEGVISVQTERNANNAVVKQTNADGTYMTTLDTADGEIYYTDIYEAALADSTLLKSYMNDGYSEANALELVIRDYCIDFIWTAKTNTASDMIEICQYWNTASTALEQFAGEARSEYFAELKASHNGKNVVETVSGITTKRVNSFNGTALGDTYDVLEITINDLDPKAIYNFAFNVCPLHYYSGTYNGTDYVAAAEEDYSAYVTAGVESGYTLTNFGIDTGNSDFFNNVLSTTEKNRLPVGAGCYKASSSDGTAVTTENYSRFYSDKYVYYERNTYFETTGEGISNAIIKYVRYKELTDNTVITSLIAQEIDYGTPSATVANQTQLASASDYLSSDTLYRTNGYGYVGINPKYVPDVEVRQAIMKAMNTSSIVKNYYTEDYASVIYRPMSMTSWAYPTGCTEYDSIAYTTDISEIQALVESAGYKLNSSGIYTKGDTTLKLTFTIAGDSTDHPAYDMFNAAADILNQAGFDITVKTDTNALSKLASGTLAVWAAAWTSTVDPDMYQVFHKDSTASSVKNWNYSNILNNADGSWDYEYEIVQELSDVIDQARETNNQDTRKALYSSALDLVMDLAVELPTYQRMDNEVFNKVIIDRSSLTASPTCYQSLLDRIWEVDYN